ncbi:exostosin-3-like [Plodia interpunctella]|uniref:exostosin-3-like n=1 Tax=Plodia interpunctella TaxID=58824 RepID=UPI0023682DAB|nr:exostosin-3-like [Plodia interpunctella]
MKRRNMLCRETVCKFNKKCLLCIVIVFAIGLSSLFYCIKYTTHNVSNQAKPYAVINSRILAPVMSALKNEIPTHNEKTRTNQSHKIVPHIIHGNTSTNCPKIQPHYYIVAYATTNPGCRMYSCFNYSRCPLVDGFRVHLNDFDKHMTVHKDYTTTFFSKMLSFNNVVTMKKEQACVDLILVDTNYKGKVFTKTSELHKSTSRAVNKTLLNFGQTSGNNVVCNLAQGSLTDNVGNAILAQSTFSQQQYRPEYDVIIPPAQVANNGDVWNHITSRIGAKKKYFLSFQGKPSKSINKIMTTAMNVLNKMAKYSQKSYIIQFSCKKVDKQIELTPEDWALCDDSDHRRKILEESTFALIIISSDSIYVSTTVLQTRLCEALESGAIPVILGGDRIRLPFEEVLDWRKAVITLPIIRVSELKFLLKTFTNEDILTFQRQGRLFWERYLSSVQTILDTLLATIRSRLNIPPKVATSITNTYKLQLKKTKENFTRVSSQSYKRNFTVGLVNGYDQWNVWGDPFTLHPQLPWDPLITPELGESTAKQFGHNCLDHVDNSAEKFTIVILAHDRFTPLPLAQSLKLLSNISNLNKILVVTSDQFNISTDGWPKLDVSIITVKRTKKSPSNLFLPYDLVDTEAVLCLDEEFILTPKEINFAFKIWREHRDQIVGFHGQHYALDKTNTGLKHPTIHKVYHNNNSIQCEASIVLPAAAFIHRYYLWAYWQYLPLPIRRYVNMHQNCEDIAINFLVSHITRKPAVLIEPIPTGVNNSSKKLHHKPLTDRHKNYEDKQACLQFFTKVMGYNPLLTIHHQVKIYSKQID